MIHMLMVPSMSRMLMVPRMIHMLMVPRMSRMCSFSRYFIALMLSVKRTRKFLLFSVIDI